MLSKFRRIDETPVLAIRFEFDSVGFSYQKWGGVQKCKPGDWIVKSGQDLYTVDAASFAGTYRHVGNGVYHKTSCVWAEVATAAGSIQTKEGATRYEPGDMLVYNDEQRCDGYSMQAERFQELYEPDTQ